MKKIDQETVRQILDTANIVEVVSDFVSLKRRGATPLVPSTTSVRLLSACRPHEAYASASVVAKEAPPSIS